MTQQMTEEIMTEEKKDRDRAVTKKDGGTNTNLMENKIDTNQAKEILRKEMDRKIRDCGNEVAQVLKKHNCQIDVTMLLQSDGRNIPEFRIIPNG